MTYGIAEHVWALVPVSSVSLALYGVMAYGYLSAVGREALPGFAVGIFGLGMIPLPFLVFGGWASAGVVVGFCYGIQLLPAVVASCRTSVLTGRVGGHLADRMGRGGGVARVRPRRRRLRAGDCRSRSERSCPR